MLIDNFIKYLRYEKNYSSHTEISYFNDLTQFKNFIEQESQNQGDEIKITDIENDLIRRWIAQLMEQNLKPRSVRRKLSALNSFYKYLIKIGVVTKNQAKFVSGPKLDKKLPVFAKDKDLELIIKDENEFTDDFKGHRDRFLIDFLYVTGMRKAELIGLKDEDVDFENKTIRVTGKGNKQRLIPISDETLYHLSEYITLRNTEIKNKSIALFVKNNGNPLNHNIVYDIVHKHLSNIPTLSKKSPHVLRHSFATEMLNNGAEINAVKELLGHQSLASTEVYTHVSLEELKNIYQNAHPRAIK
ncbi:MAG: tyrosine-type recombinase/integrase [Dysgonamonadaceae bacterium]